MHQGSTFSTSGPGLKQPGCTFCQREALTSYLLKETTNFRIVADHAPLVEGHLLIIPQNHYTCYGDVPGNYDAELTALKDEVKHFFAAYYDSIIYWEHGIFHQTVFHAHLHCFPFGDIVYHPEKGLHARLIANQEEIRNWHKAHGQYFYLEDTQHAALFAPESDIYTKIVQGVLWPGVVAHSPVAHWRSTKQRQEDGCALINAVKARWQQFQNQEEVQHAD